MRRLVNNWLYGEVSPKITGRLDTDIYTAGCMRLENMYVHRQGGISRRPPLRPLYNYIVRITENITRMIPFVVSSNESYILLMGVRKNEPPLESNAPIWLYDGTTVRALLSGEGGYDEKRTKYHNTWGELTQEELYQVRFANYYNDLYLVHEKCPLLRLRRVSSAQCVLEFPEVKVNQDVKRYRVSFSISAISSITGDYRIYVPGQYHTFTRTSSDTSADAIYSKICAITYDGWTAERTSSGVDFIPSNKADEYTEWKLATSSTSGDDLSSCDFKLTKEGTLGITYAFTKAPITDDTGLVFGQDDFLPMNLNVSGYYASNIAVIAEKLWLVVNGNPCRIFVSRPYGTSQIIAPKDSNDTILDFIQYEIVATTTEKMKDEKELPVEIARDTNGSIIYKGTSYDQKIWKYSSDPIYTKTDYDNALEARECDVEYDVLQDGENDTPYRRVSHIYRTGEFSIVWNRFFHFTSDDFGQVGDTQYHYLDTSKMFKDASGNWESSIYKWYNSESSAQTEDEKYENITADDYGTHGIIYYYTHTQDVYKNPQKKYFSGTTDDTFVSDPSDNPMSAGYYERNPVFTSDYKTKVYEKRGEYVYSTALTTPLDTVYDDVSGMILSISSSGTIICEVIPYYQFNLSSDSDIYKSYTDIDKVATASTGMELQLASGRNDHISWLALGDYIMAGTESAEWRMDTSINALDGKASKYSAFGSNNGLVTYVGTDLIFLQKGNKLRLLYKDDYGLQNIELTLTNPEIMSGTILNMVGIMEPEPAIAILKSETIDNVEKRSIIYLSVDRTNGIQAFSRWTTEQYIYDICVIEVNGHQRLVAYIKETGSNTDRRFLTYFDFDDKSGYKDFGYKSGLVDKLHPFTSIMRALPFDTQTQDGSVTLGEAKNVSKIVFRCLDTGKVITWHNEKDRNISRTPICCDRNGDYVGGLADFSMNVNGGTTRDLMIAVESYEDEPMTLLAMAYELRVNRNGG